MNPDEDREGASPKVHTEGATEHYTEWERDLIDSFDLPTHREQRELECPSEDV